MVATGAGLLFAQNMMYRHTITVYDTDRQLVATIPDTVDLAAFGIEGYTGEHRGAPVEAAATSVGAFVYVSNYQMYGQGFGRPGGDGCDNSGWDTSFVYRVSVDSMAIDQVIPVGAVPKYLAITPDDRTVLVSNWCSFDLSVIDTATASEIARVPVGRHPRGIAITKDGTVAFVAVMGSRDIAVLDLATLTVSWFEDVGANPRHLVLSPDDETLYVTLNGTGRVAALDTATGEVRATVTTGRAPRSMAISDDGTSLYVVNYLSDTMSEVDTETLEVIETFAVADKPIGVAFDSGTRTVWVSSYSGAITVFAETDPSAEPEVGRSRDGAA